MNRHDEHVLECALHVELAPPQADLTLRVLQRWRAGPPGGVDSPARAGTRRFAASRRWPLAAGLLVTAALVAFAVSMASPPPLGRATAPLAVLRPGSLARHQATQFVADDTLVTESAAAIELADGTTVALDAQTLLRLAGHGGEAELALLLGTVRIERRKVPGALRVATPLGTLELGPHALCAVRIVTRDYLIPFTTLTTELHMNKRTIMLSTSITLLAGAARMLDGPFAGAILPEQTIQDPEPTDPRDDLLMAEAGTWKLTITDFAPGGAESRTYEGVENCTAGPGREWLVSGMEFTRNGRKISSHVVLGYDAMRLRYVGSFVDSFGGNMSLLEGAAGADPKVRVLETRGFRGEREDVGRLTMCWLDDTNRRTTFEMREGERWVEVRRIEHRRQK
jgi:hypothetical protein